MDEDKVLTYEEAKHLCRIAFDAGADYGSTSMQFNCNAVAYDWEHWLKRNEGLFRPKPTVEDVLREFVERLDEIGSEDDCVGEAEQECRACIRRDIAAAYAEYAEKLRLAGEDA